LDRQADEAVGAHRRSEAKLHAVFFELGRGETGLRIGYRDGEVTTNVERRFLAGDGGERRRGEEPDAAM
jgi:hypothetical protein